MRILLTGATGFIGRHLCERLVARGDEIVALVRWPETEAPLPPSVKVLAGDLSIFADPTRVLPPCDVVIHLAGVVTAERLSEYEQVNFAGVKHLLECIGRQSWKPARFLFASSLAALGPSRAGEAHTERDLPRPIDPYGEAKARAEALVAAAPFPTTCFRPGAVLGPGDPQSFTLFRSANKGFGFRVAGPPQELSFVDVRDLVEAIVLMADDRRPGAYTYFASHPDRIDVLDLWSEVGRAVGRTVLVVPFPRWALYVAMRLATALAALFRFRNQLDAKQYKQMAAAGYVCTSAALRRDLGWGPRHALADCIAHAAHGYRAAGALPAGPTRRGADGSRSASAG
ncbi:MAG TPA: NAD(P)-dependent oxidoreductase [Polyangiaceae bacterium]|jgi:nucleoside-diphosphate-sugar epimerase